MMPVEWPIAAPLSGLPANRAVALAPAGRDRLSIVRADFFLDEEARLSEQERALMGGMLAGLIDQLIDEYLLGLPPLLSARVEPVRQGVARRLWRAGVLDRSDLVALLLRRSDEQRISGRGRRAGGPAASPVEALVGDQNEAVAAAAMALTVARGRRRDRFGRLGLEFDDLPPEDADVLIYFLASAARIEAVLGSGDEDEALASASEALLARQEPGNQLERRVTDLALALHSAGVDGDEEIAHYAELGDVALVAASLAVRGGIDAATGWCLLVEEGADEVMLLTRLAGLDRAAAARLIAALAEALGAGDPAEAIGLFDAWTDARVDERRRWWRLPKHYRVALDALGGHHG